MNTELYDMIGQTLDLTKIRCFFYTRYDPSIMERSLDWVSTFPTFVGTTILKTEPTVYDLLGQTINNDKKTTNFHYRSRFNTCVHTSRTTKWLSRYESEVLRLIVLNNN